jgi:ParB family chromosome partitioning protein
LGAFLSKEFILETGISMTDLPEEYKEIELKRIRPSKLNPRLEMNIERLNDLASSIREVGLLEPIIVRPAEGEYEVVVGERRYRAAQQAGLQKIASVIREYSDDEVVRLNLIENVQREDLSAIEKGTVCKYLLQECSDIYDTQKAVADKIGVSPETVSAWLRAVDVVPEEARTYVAPSSLSGEVPEGKIDYQTAVKVGRTIKEPERQVQVIRKLAEKHLPVKERSVVIDRIALEPEKSVDEVIDEVADEAIELPITLHFAAEDKKSLIEGLKTQVSSPDKPHQNIKAGAIVHAMVWEPDVATLRIMSVERKKLRYFNNEDAEREGYASLAQFKKKWQETHRQWDDDQLLYIIRFQRITQ